MLDEEKKPPGGQGGKLSELEDESDFVQKNRGFWLTGFLVLMCLGNAITIYNYFTYSESIIQAYPKARLGIQYILSVLCAFNIIMGVTIWRGKRWGVYGFYAVAVITFFIHMYIDLGIANAWFGLYSVLLVYLLSKKRWRYFN